MKHKDEEYLRSLSLKELFALMDELSIEEIEEMPILRPRPEIVVRERRSDYEI